MLSKALVFVRSVDIRFDALLILNKHALRLNNQEKRLTKRENVLKHSSALSGFSFPIGLLHTELGVQCAIQRRVVSFIETYRSSPNKQDFVRF